MHWQIPLALLIALNLWATVVSLRSPLYERGQRIGQIALVWLLPLLGAAFVLLFALSQHGAHQDTTDGALNAWENIDAGPHHGHGD